MAQIVGKHAFLAILRDEGIELLFGNPGSTELALMDALAVESAPRFVLGLHEGIVMSMAHGYAASTGRLVAVNLHAAPGLGNALGMLYNIKKANLPVLVTAGQQDLSMSIREPLLWDDLATMARPFVKWAVEVTQLSDLPRILRRAAKTALAPPAGPVFISLPGDILTKSADLDLLGTTRVGTANRGDADGLMRAAALICNAQAPCIFAGDSVCSSRAHAAVALLAEFIGAPVFLEAMADRAAFPTSHALFAGTIARLGPRVRDSLAPYDLIISIGGDLFTESLATGTDPIAPGKMIVHIDDDAWQLGKNYPTAVAILGEAAAVLPELIELVRRGMDAKTRLRNESRGAAVALSNEARRIAIFRQAEAVADAYPIAPIALLHALGRMMPPRTIIIEESLSSNSHLVDLLPLNDECSYVGLRGGGIGAGLPQAIGAKLGCRDRPVVALIGDGSALFSIQALWTAAHEKLPIIFIILNNASYRILKQRTRALGDHAARSGRYVGMDLIDPTVSFVRLSESLGVSAVRVQRLEEFRIQFAQALGISGPSLIDVAVERSL